MIKRSILICCLVVTAVFMLCFSVILNIADFFRGLQEDWEWQINRHFTAYRKLSEKWRSSGE